MEYLLSLLFLGLHLLDYEYNLPTIVFFGAGLVLFCALFRVCYNKSKDFLCTCMMMFCHTWQASWMNIFGDWGSPIQITWFYLIGVFILVYCMINIRKVIKVPLNAGVLAMFVSLFIFLPYPLIISPSLSEGMKEFLIIAFFLIIGFVAFVFKGTIAYEKRKYIVNSYLFCIMITCVLLLLQYVIYKFTGEALFRYSVGTYYGNPVTSSKLLMEDTSCSTIMIGGAAFYLLEKLNKRNWPFILAMAVIIMAGIGVTTRRTSIVTLAIVLVFYVLLHYKGTIKRINMAVLVAGLLSVMFLYLYYTRSILDLFTLTYNNGRFEGYAAGLKLLWDNPFGIGYDNVNLAAAVGGIVPHNSMLRWLNMGGFIFGIFMFLILIYYLTASFKKKNKTEFWFIGYCLIASNLIPDILNARIFILPIMMALLIADEEEKVPNEKYIAVQSRNEQQSRL
ncbi:MAG: hypothetical protein PUC29_00315 [Clostridia bacterium]|nr:hypothetical protein [Clostridia bacterium]